MSLVILKPFPSNAAFLPHWNIFLNHFTTESKAFVTVPVNENFSVASAASSHPNNPIIHTRGFLIISRTKSPIDNAAPKYPANKFVNAATGSLNKRLNHL